MSKETWCKIIETKEHGDILIQKFNDDEGLGLKITFQCAICEVSSAFNLKGNIDEDGQHIEFLSMIERTNDESISKMKEEMGLS